MLKVKTKVSKSGIAGVGLGLFADEFIPKGMLIWQFEPGKDKRISKSELRDVSEEELKHIKKYAYAKKDSPTLTLPAGDAIYVNHSDNPNSYGESDDLSFAIRDIMPGDEITEDYTKYDDGEFCASFLHKNKEI